MCRAESAVQIHVRPLDGSKLGKLTDKPFWESHSAVCMDLYVRSLLKQRTNFRVGGMIRASHLTILLTGKHQAALQVFAEMVRSRQIFMRRRLTIEANP